MRPRPPALHAETPLERLTPAERLNFLLTNRIPRRAATRFMGWFSKLEHPLLARASIALWQRFADDLRLFEARQRHFRSLHECFIRELKAGVRPVDLDPAVLASPCDAEVGAFGELKGLEALQAKGFPYGVEELLGDRRLAERYRDGRYLTLRLKSSMYHHFHAPLKGQTHEIVYHSGDTWNVNPIALRVVERLFCRNERAVIEYRTEGESLLLVPVAAVLVASMHFSGVDVPLNLRYRGPNRIPWAQTFEKGQEMGYFEHGSTIILITTKGFQFHGGVETGKIVRMGSRLMTRCQDDA
ncbi:MAG: archaetidylserine decarboxylase [Pseudomonadota bacterium]